MSNHDFTVFDNDVAKKYGIRESIILCSFYRLVKHKAANSAKTKDGKYWVMNSATSLSKLYPFMSFDQVKKTVVKMEKEGLIESTIITNSPFDRTKSYTITEKGLKELGKQGLFDNAESKNPSSESAQSERANLPDENEQNSPMYISNPKSVSVSPNPEEEIVCSNEHTKEDNSEMENLFEVFWTKYPKKQSKKVAKVSFMRYVSKSNIKQVLDGLDRWLRSKQWHKDNGQYIPLPATWLNQEKWNDELKQEDLVDGGVEDFLNDDDEYDLCDPRRYREKESNDFIDADYTTKTR